MIKRDIENIIIKKLFKKKAIIIIGARQVGKTTLVKNIAENLSQQNLYWNCDEPDIQILLAKPTSTQLKQLIGTNKLLIIDEAQRIKNIGLTSKLIVDQIPDVQLILTGSSAFDLANELTESLTGRKFEYHLHPFSFAEMVNSTNIIDEKRLHETRMIYGCYPDIINNPGDEEDRLLEISSSFLFKDILSLGNIRKPDVLMRLIQALSLQIGSQVSYNELAQIIGIDKNTISKYIDLLEKTFVIFSLNSFSRNARNELKKSKKIYFWDLGIRNAIIKNFNPLELRADKGAIWENYMISERLKFLNNNSLKPNYYFWRTIQQQEIDYIEDYQGKLSAYEIKWNTAKSVKVPTSFSEYYPIAEYKQISRDNFEEFLQ